MFPFTTMHSFAINHIALNCHDVAAQETFFARHFGFQRSRTFNAGKPDEGSSLFSVGNSTRRIQLA